jgi:hypothetical protein
MHTFTVSDPWICDLSHRLLTWIYNSFQNGFPSLCPFQSKNNLEKKADWALESQICFGTFHTFASFRPLERHQSHLKDGVVFLMLMMPPHHFGWFPGLDARISVLQ